ncbi:unnamed protein product [Pleuronectes platessa]|uniref:Uncharacterized protein n=1 Tax=Pleuronectes platessa TaxID=8262 RepID=A0A9N7YN29_PLEPL|nr:unnamed protein product [Pleuronectes platessa]
MVAKKMGHNENPVVIVVTPLVALMEDQVKEATAMGITAMQLGVHDECNKTPAAQPRHKDRSRNYDRPPAIRARCGRTMDYDLWIAHQRSQWWIQYGGFYIVRADRSGNDGSCVGLSSYNGGGPCPRRRLMMDPNKRQWTMTVDYSGSDLDGGS